MTKLRSRYGGTARILVILAALILLMLVIIAIPAFKRFNFKSEQIACEQAIKSANDGLKIQFLSTYEKESITDARKSLAQIMPEREDICPRHGNVYLTREEHGIFEAVCGLHDWDAAKRTRLNASYAGNMLTEERKNIFEKSDFDGTEPEYITININNGKLDIVYVTEEVNIKRGTKTTKGYKGTVAFYGVGDDGDINYFLYADDDYCAKWRKGDGWTGTAYDNYNP